MLYRQSLQIKKKNFNSKLVYQCNLWMNFVMYACDITNFIEIFSLSCLAWLYKYL